MSPSYSIILPAFNFNTLLQVFITDTLWVIMIQVGLSF
ncbi:MAG: hypothetical protein K0R09_2873, partial [Clostridiales bacterium]|nr:hypothetical protein [Clostridiales bacterium]